MDYLFSFRFVYNGVGSGLTQLLVLIFYIWIIQSFSSQSPAAAALSQSAQNLVPEPNRSLGLRLYIDSSGPPGNHTDVLTFVIDR